jgi:S1-C subfamily serine protease
MDKVSTSIFVLGILIAIFIIYMVWSTNALSTSLDNLSTKTDVQFRTLSSSLDSLNKSLQFESEDHFVSVIQNLDDSIVAVVTFPVHNVTESSVIYVDQNGQQGNMGAGFSIDKNGNILTAYHIIRDTNQGFIVLKNGTIMQIMSNPSIFPELDLAIIHINSGVPSVSIEDTNSPVPIGTSLAFTGFPLADVIIQGQITFPRITTRGIISDIIPFIYNNTLIPVYILGASVNGGDSGGPVYSLKTGKVIGIINERFTEKEGIGISTPINQYVINLLLQTP